MKKIHSRKVLIISFIILMLSSAISPLVYFFRGQISIVDTLLSLSVSVTFLYIGYLILESYMISKNRLYIAFFIALFLWPIITTAISFSISGAQGLFKKGLENKIGGFGDFVSCELLLEDLILGAKLVRLGMFLMLTTNILLLVPFWIMHSREAKRAEVNS